MLWFRRFETYRLAGPGRAMLAVYRDERARQWADELANLPAEQQTGLDRARRGAIKSVPRSWRDAAARWDWVARAAAWDVHEAERERAEQEAEQRRLREQAREVRRGLLGAGHNLLAKTMVLFLGKNAATPDAQTMVRILGAIEKFNRDSRAEYGDLPARDINLHGAVLDIGLTVDDVAAADAAIQEWERRRFGDDSTDADEGDPSTDDTPAGAPAGG